MAYVFTDDDCIHKPLEKHSEDLITDDEPPAYDSIAPQPADIHGFQPWFNVYFKFTWRANLYTLGQSKDAPRYATSMHSRLSSSPKVILHGGPTGDYPWLATADGQNKLSMYDSVIGVPGVAGGQDTMEKMKMVMHRGTQSYIFSAPVTDPSEKGMRIERFEWRSSRGAEVKLAGKRLQGWKLVRLDSAAQSGGSRGSRAVGRTSDGLEVVAVWADSVHLTMSKMGRFMFMGAGATGELGEMWTRLAVVSCIRIVQIQCEMTLGTTGAAGAGSGASAANAAAVAC